MTQRGRSIFRPVFMGGPSFSVKPITLALNHDEIPEGELAVALKNAVPQGFVGTSPYVVKTLDGEYLVYADGTAQFVPLGNSPGERVSLNGVGTIPIVNSVVTLGRLDSIQVRLGQEAVAPSNRLLNVRINVLLSRGAPLIPQTLEPDPYFISNVMSFIGVPLTRRNNYSGEAVKALFPAPPSIWTEEEFVNISAAAAAPRREELEDVALIDSIYIGPKGTTLPERLPPLRVAHKFTYAALHEILCRDFRAGWRRIYKGPAVGDPFYCTGVHERGFFSVPDWPSVVEYFDLKPNETWESQRLAAHNTKVFMGVLKTYPFPRPIPLAPGFWYQENREALAGLVNSGLIFNATLARFFITLLTLTSIEIVSAQIVDWAEDRAEHKQKWAIMRIAASVALAAIFSAALAPALASILPTGIPISGATAASAVTGFAREQFTQEELSKIGEDMEQAVKIFEVNDPLYAEELKTAVMTLEWWTGEFGETTDTLSQIQDQEQNPLPTTDELGVSTEYPSGTSVQTALIGVGAGVGAVGLLLYLLR